MGNLLFRDKDFRREYKWEKQSEQQIKRAHCKLTLKAAVSLRARPIHQSLLSTHGLPAASGYDWKRKGRLLHLSIGKRELDDTGYHFYRAEGTSCLFHKEAYQSLSKTVSLMEQRLFPSPLLFVPLPHQTRFFKYDKYLGHIPPPHCTLIAKRLTPKKSGFNF